MGYIKASIIIPTRNRAVLFADRLVTILSRTPEINSKHAELIIVHDSDDKDTRDLVDYYLTLGNQFNHVVVPPWTIPSVKWNEGLKIAMGEWLVTIADDSIPCHEKWLQNAFENFNKGFLGLPDGVTGPRNNQFTPLYMATRGWLKKYHGGVLVIPKYKIWYADIETAERAHRSSTYQVAHKSEVLQLHKEFGSAPNDEIYRIGESRRAEDLETFKNRRAQGFPDDFESVI